MHLNFFNRAVKMLKKSHKIKDMNFTINRKKLINAKVYSELHLYMQPTILESLKNSLYPADSAIRTSFNRPLLSI
jgi:hypothetical protein